MVGPSLALSDPLVQKAPHSSGKKCLALAFCVGFVCAVIFGGSARREGDEPSINMVGQQVSARFSTPLQPVARQFRQPTLTHHMKTSKASSARKLMSQLRSKFPGTDVEIDATGVTFPIEAVCEVSVLGKGCDGEETPSGVSGVVKFKQTDAETLAIDYEIKGLAPGLHGFHVHEKADFSNGCASAGPHYNPFKKLHGGPGDEERHVGDLGNIEAGADGIAKGTMTDKLIKLFGEYTVVERSMMVHADPDDLGKGDLEGWEPGKPLPAAPAQHTKTTGNAGARIGCGVIKMN